MKKNTTQAALDHVTEDGIECDHAGPRTTVVNKRKTDEWDVYVGREDDGQADITNTPPRERGWLGNPFTVSEHGRHGAIDGYREVFIEKVESDPEFRGAVESLRGKTLACYCKPKACHGDVIVKYLHGDR